MDKRLTLWILAGMILGVIVGYAVKAAERSDDCVGVIVESCMAAAPS